MAQTTLYGIKNCDTVKKARRWLEDRGLKYQFHDFRSDGLSDKQVRQWLERVGAETLINRRSTTWKGLSDEQKGAADNADKAVNLLTEHPTLIKRPLLETGSELRVGFKADDYSSLFNA